MMNSQTMDNSICTQQNSDVILGCLVAQSEEYTKAKRNQFVNLIAIVLLSLLTTISSFCNDAHFLAVVSLAAVVVAIASKKLEKREKSIREHAAMIQQYIDSSLYSGVTNTDQNRWGPSLTSSDIAEIISGIDNDAKIAKRDWYSDYSTMSPEDQVFYCQKENLRWDRKLRNDYTRFVSLSFGALALISIVAALIINPSFTKTVIVIAGLVPALDHCFSVSKSVKQDTDCVQAIEKKCNEIEKDTDAQCEDLCEKLISIQKLIYDHRRNGYLIPDWFYSKHQKKYQKEESQIADSIKRMHDESRKM